MDHASHSGSPGLDRDSPWHLKLVVHIRQSMPLPAGRLLDATGKGHCPIDCKRIWPLERISDQILAQSFAIDSAHDFLFCQTYQYLHQNLIEPRDTSPASPMRMDIQAFKQ